LTLCLLTPPKPKGKQGRIYPMQPIYLGITVQELLMNYLPILVFVGVAAGLGLVLVLAAVIVAVRNPDAEKTSAYECGFNAFDDARMKFDVRFYLVSILFIIFDLEVAFLFPWATSFQYQGMLYHQLGAYRFIALDDIWLGLLCG